MQFALWSVEGLIISLVLIVAAALIARFMGERKRGELSSQLEQIQQQLQTLQEEKQRLVEQGSVLTQQLHSKEQQQHALELEKSRLEERLQAANEHNQRSQQGYEQQQQELKERLQRQDIQQQTLQKEHQSLITQYAELKTNLDNKEEHFKEQLAQLNEAKKMLSQEFENIANKVFEEKNKTFTHTSQTNIDQLLKPFREQIEAFQKRTNEVHDASLKGQANLNAEIQKVLSIGIKMSDDAHSLTTALKGNSQQRGAWGEAQLERTLEMSGLTSGAHYEAQSSFKDEQGTTKRTDYLIKLPDGKHLIIDSKVTLNAYTRVVEAETQDEYLAAMREHCLAVRKHIDDLRSKDYSSLTGMRSPNYVLMFMPIEAAYIEALKFDKALFEEGYNKGVVLVSHTTLIPILRTVANLWMLDDSTKEARELGDRAGDIYNSVCLVAERLEKLGRQLNTAGNSYNETVTALAGQQGLYGKVERFKQISNKASKELPSVEPKALDVDHHRLQLIAEPIMDEQ